MVSRAAIDSLAQKLYDKGFLDRRISYQNYNEPGNKYPMISQEDLVRKMEDLKQIKQMNSHLELSVGILVFKFYYRP